MYGPVRTVVWPFYYPQLRPLSLPFLEDGDVGRDELKKFVLARLRSLQKLPWTVRMFFLTPDTQYAAL